MNEPLCVFNIRPERRSRLAVSIEIYRTLGDFHGAVRTEARADGTWPVRTRGLIGQCVGVTARNGARRTGLFAIVRIPQQHLTMSTISHEAFHATMRWAQRRGFEAIHTNGTISNMSGRPHRISLEERAATVHDTICRRIVVECNRRRLLP